MFKRHREYESIGMKLLSLPASRKDVVNKKKKNIGDLESITAANMIEITGIKPDSPMILCGRSNKVYPVLQQLLRMTSKTYVIVGTPKDLDNSIFFNFNIEWKSNTLMGQLQAGNGIVSLRPGGETSYVLRDSIISWDDHLPVLCLGNGLQVDSELLNLLNGLGQYIIITESLSRSIKGIEGCKLTIEELLGSMDYILVSSIGTAAKGLMAVLPSYECEKVSNTMDFSLHRDMPNYVMDGFHHRTGGGARVGQTRTLETRCTFSQEDITRLQDNGAWLIYNTKVAHTWIAKIIR